MTMRTTSALIAAVTLYALPAAAWKITETPLASGSGPDSIVAGPDGNMWFTEDNHAIGVIDSRTGALLHEYPTNNACYPSGITLASDGNVWYTCLSAASIGRMTVTGTNTEFPGSFPTNGSIVSGRADGFLYFGTTVGRVGVADTTGTMIDSMSFPGLNVSFLSSGGDGYVWVASLGDSKLWGIRYDAAGAYFHTRYISVATSPTTVGWCSQNGGLYWAGDSTIGFAKYGTAINETKTGGTGDFYGVVCTANGDAYFVPFLGESFIARYSDLMQFPLASNSHPHETALGPDGSIWFTEPGTDKIGRLRLNPPGDVNGSGTVDVADVFYLINFLFAGGPAPQ